MMAYSANYVLEEYQRLRKKYPQIKKQITRQYLEKYRNRKKYEDCEQRC